MTEVRVNCSGETCPVPLVETRKAIRKAQKGDIIEVIGTHPASKKEIPMCCQSAKWDTFKTEHFGIIMWH